MAASRASAGALPAPSARAQPGGAALARGLAGAYLSVLVLLPMAALAYRAQSGGWGTFWEAITAAQGVAALKLTLMVSAVVVAIDAVTGTAIAWVLVRDEFRGKSVVNALIDLPFALPTIVAGLTLLLLYGPKSPVGVSLAYTRTGIGLALLFVTMPFVVRTVQPVLLELDREQEEAASSLGAGAPTIFRRVIFPNLLPAILSGVALAFARAIGEFGSIVLLSGNIPFRTEVSSVYIFGRVESFDPVAAAAVSILLLAICLLVLFSIGGVRRWATRHDG